ncbi:hypothetical protein ABB30_09025 [Stenotrophomonas ginsengisoli]|uniref:Secreted protein n=1 Tax=Stenotrophomonas ginsengisoli TaxID=336566 RepID=A0A0R0D5M1_9GAMM|nr:hypothetical protein ABB30_09025 [Stenotrophomonas ginsengisoli]
MHKVLFVWPLVVMPVLLAGSARVAAAVGVLAAQSEPLQRELEQLWRDSNEGDKVDMDSWLYKQREACMETVEEGSVPGQVPSPAYDACVLARLNDQRVRLLRHRDCAQTTVFSCELDDGRQAKMCIAHTPSPQVSLHIDDGKQVQQWSQPMQGAQASGPWLGFGRGVYGNIIFVDGQQQLEGWLRYDRLGGGPFQASAYSAGIHIAPIDARTDGAETRAQTLLCREQAPTTYLAWPEVVAEHFELAGLCYDIAQDRWQHDCP